MCAGVGGGCRVCSVLGWDSVLWGLRFWDEHRWWVPALGAAYFIYRDDKYLD